MGLLNRDDARIHRAYFEEMTKLIGIQVLYQYVIKQELTIHSEDNSTLSQPMQLDILFDENPSQKTLNRRKTELILSSSVFLYNRIN